MAINEYSYSVNIEINSPSISRAAILKKEFENKVRKINIPGLEIKQVQLAQSKETRKEKTDMLLEILTEKPSSESTDYLQKVRQRILKIL